jgi:hypothetical protein
LVEQFHRIAAVARLADDLQLGPLARQIASPVLRNAGSSAIGARWAVMTKQR